MGSARRSRIGCISTMACSLPLDAASLASGGSTTGPPAEINDNFNHSWSNVGAGLGEVFALSCALSRHQWRPSPQCAARSWISAHRRCAVFPVLSRQKVWVFRPWQSSYQAKRVQPSGNLVGRRLPAELTRRPETISAGREACFQCFRSGAGVR